MSSLGALRARASLPGWLLVGLAVLGRIADLEGAIGFMARIVSIPLPHIPNLCLWSIALVGFGYLAWVVYAESVTEPLRQLFRSAGVRAAGDRSQLSRAVEEILGRRDDAGRLARTLLDETTLAVEGAQARVAEAFESKGLLARTRVRNGQRRFVRFLEEYRKAVYRLRDGGLAARYNFKTHPNFPTWERFDTALRDGVHALTNQTRYGYLRNAVGGYWREEFASR